MRLINIGLHVLKQDIILRTDYLKYFRIKCAIVNVGMKSAKGKASSTKFKTAPVAPNLPPKDFIKINAESGAQITSLNSPMPGMAKLIQPIKSITIQNVREGTVVVCWSVFMASIYANTMQDL